MKKFSLATAGPKVSPWQNAHILIINNDPATLADHVTVLIDRLVQWERLKRDRAVLRSEIARRYQSIPPTSRIMKDLLQQAKRVARTDSVVLLLGEAGTGKEILARQIHGWSARRDRLFVSVNCGSSSPEALESELFGGETARHPTADRHRIGGFALADGGTIFLDEIAALPPNVQAKLLRLLQERASKRGGGTRTLNPHARIITATHRDLSQTVRSGRFREDLWSQLNRVALTIPPLRDRKEDIPQLVDFFIKQYCREVKRSPMRCSGRAWQTLMTYDWKGNVRELKNAIEKAVLLNPGDGVIEPEDFFLSSPPPRDPPDGRAWSLEDQFHAAVRHCKRQIILQALDRAARNRTKAAHILGIQRTHLSRLMKQLDI